MDWANWGLCVGGAATGLAAVARGYTRGTRDRWFFWLYRTHCGWLIAVLMSQLIVSQMWPLRIDGPSLAFGGWQWVGLIVSETLVGVGLVAATLGSTGEQA